MNEHTLSTLDRAHAARLKGDQASALRLGLACARAAPEAPGPIALLARVLVDQDRLPDAGKVAEKLVMAEIARGDLPAAVVASTLALDAGAPQGPLLSKIADAFGRRDKKGPKASVAPPPFPTAADLPEGLQQLDEEPLLVHAADTVAAFLETPIAASMGPRPTALPLFSALAPKALARLLGTLRVEEVSGGQEIVRQGDLGQEAFVVARGLLAVVRHQGADETQLAQLGPGAMFGEMALLSESPRSASVVSKEPTQLLVLSRDEIERAARDAPGLTEELSTFCRERMQDNLVRHARMLASVPVEARLGLLAQLESRFYDAGEFIIHREQEAERIHLVASGVVSVSVPEGDDRLVLATLGPGDVLGEISVILHRPASADVTALYPTVTYALGREALSKLMRQYPGLLVELYELATRREDEIRAASGDEVLSADDTVLV
jgi:cAMP-dependent protein kinase regulator